ncbi:ATPase [Nocardiopsis terrae]|uniref:histidine kinase n=1 Tax=Nocardiopsis terrae TaxID=372655 RepID=A0ABR9HIN9_9ACTN|nr:ATP-binding protein [Nocardiopsis terrae]MBE1458867.1 sensor histidine kinase regulating citrate/malate metabolism [Nocardiopsis terrae]GHC86817.1 ATPase [Nocardiopsis terrae]
MRFGAPRTTLAGQFLALQLGIVVTVLVMVAAVSLAQSDARLRQTESRRMLSVAESTAARDIVRAGLQAEGSPEVLAPTAESVRVLSSTDHLIVHDSDGRALTLDPGPGDGGSRAEPGIAPALRGRAWTGVTEIDGNRTVAAAVPVIGEGGAILGVVVAGVDYPGTGELLVLATPNLLVYLGIASVLGVAGSLLLSRRVKRQTLGLEPDQIARLVEHREAMLYGIKEGVLGLNAEHRVTLANAAAVRLLGLPPGCVGSTLADLGVGGELEDVLLGRVRGRDTVVALGDRLVALNRMPLAAEGSPAGSVTTMRDRTDLVELQHELDTSKTTTETLRAQAHEFSNRLHVISGLLELREYGEAAKYVSQVGGARAQLSADVTGRVNDPSLAALLIAKTSLADEQRTRLRICPRTRLEPVSEELSDDLVTVVANLVDNALDAVAPTAGGAERPWVEVGVVGGGSAPVQVSVSDSGPGVPSELAGEVFQHGYTTKDGAGRKRGLGLAIVGLVCARRGGTATVAGSRFTAVLYETPPDPEGEN